jgi:nitrate reductase cytochrome c-type subunit
MQIVMHSPDPSKLNFQVPLEQTHFDARVKEAQRIASRYRYRGIKTHVCKVDAHWVVLWAHPQGEVHAGN